MYLHTHTKNQGRPGRLDAPFSDRLIRASSLFVGLHVAAMSLLQTPSTIAGLLPITSEVISSKRDWALLNLLINVTTSI